MILTTANFSRNYPLIEGYWNSGINYPELENGGCIRGGHTTWGGVAGAATPHLYLTPSGHGVLTLHRDFAYVPLGPHSLHFPGLMVLNGDYLVLAPGFLPWMQLSTNSHFLGYPVSFLRGAMNTHEDSCPIGLMGVDLNTLLDGAPEPAAPLAEFSLPFISPFLSRKLGVPGKS